MESGALARPSLDALNRDSRMLALFAGSPCLSPVTQPQFP